MNKSFFYTILVLLSLLVNSCTVINKGNETEKSEDCGSVCESSDSGDTETSDDSDGNEISDDSDISLPFVPFD